MDEIFAEYRGRSRFDLHVRGHKVTVDQPVGDGGTDHGPTPTELFVASIAGCVGYFASRYLQRHELPTAGLAVSATYRMSTERPHRVDSVEIRLRPPSYVPANRLSGLLAVASACTLHRTLEHSPAVDIALAEPQTQEPAPA